MVKGYMVGEKVEDYGRGIFAYMDPERWRLGERDESTSFQNKYNVFHPVDRSEVPRWGKRGKARRKKTSSLRQENQVGMNGQGVYGGGKPR
jgi:hypothetical protein